MPNRVTGMVSGLDTEQLVTAMVSDYKLKVDKNTKAQTKLSWTQDAWKTLNTKVYGLYTNISNLRFTGAYTTKKVSVSDSAKASVTATNNAVVGSQRLKITKLAETGYLTGGKIKSDEPITAKDAMSALGFEEGKTGRIEIKSKDKDGKEVVTDIDITSETTIQEVVDKIAGAGLNASFDEKQGRFYISSKTSGEENDFSISAVGGTLEDGTEINRTDSLVALAKLGLVFDTDGEGEGRNITDEDIETLKANGFTAAEITSMTGRKLGGASATIELNGVEYTNNTNDFSINGLNIKAQALTDDDGVVLTIDNDTQAIYDKIRDFLTEYNNVINEITKLYNADSAKDYEPLTDDEKAAMSDKEIEKWEAKIKDSLLRRDTTLQSVMSAMTSAMSGTIEEINGKKYSLSSFGIHTLGFLNAAENEQNAYHIDGDEDDTNTSGNKDKLMAALTEDPDSVVEFMKKLTTNLYNAIGDKMKSTTMSSAYTIYNDKQMQKDYNKYTTTIKDWESRLADKEDFYYKKFAKMESALAELQNKTSSITGLFNTGS